MRVKLLTGLTFLILLGIGYFLFMGQEQVIPAQIKKQASPPVEVTVYTIKQETMIFTKDLFGRTSAYQTAQIRPQVSGIILKRLFTEGSVVKKGQQLYQIDPATYMTAYNSAAASLGQAKADLTAAEPKARRYAKLVKSGGVSRQAYDDVVASLAQSKALVTVAKANLATAQINLNYTKVFAPISGRIGKSFVTQGALVTTDQTTALATIQNLNQIYVDVSQSSQALMKLRKQMDTKNQNPEATLFTDGETYAHKGKIMFSDVTVDEGTGMVLLRILFPNPNDELLPGLFVKARVEQSRQDDAITIPQQSVVRNADNSTTVWVVDKTGTVNTRKITVSQAIGNKWLVTSGLKRGDKIVVEGLQKIQPAAKVTSVEMQPSNN